MTVLKALIFDVDGTLAETERDGHRIAFNQAFVEAGLEWEWSVEEYGKLIETAGGKERIYAYMQQQNFLLEGDRSAVKEWIAQLHHRKTVHYKSLLSQGLIQSRPGILRLLQEARSRRVSLAIATTSTLPNVSALLQTTIASDSPHWFRLIAAGDVVPHKKPAPDIYHYVLAHLGLSAQECIVFEDSHQGLMAAQGAGLKTIVTVNAYTQAQDFTGAALVLNHLGEPDYPCKVLQDPLGYIQKDTPLERVTIAWLRDFFDFLTRLRP